MPRLAERQPLRDQRVDLLLLQQVEQCEQIVSEPRGFQPHEPLDTVRHHALAARQKPVLEDVPPQGGGFANGVPPARRTRNRPPPMQLGLENPFGPKVLPL